MLFWFLGASKGAGGRGAAVRIYIDSKRKRPPQEGTNRGGLPGGGERPEGLFRAYLLTLCNFDTNVRFGHCLKVWEGYRLKDVGFVRAHLFGHFVSLTEIVVLDFVPSTWDA